MLLFQWISIDFYLKTLIKMWLQFFDSTMMSIPCPFEKNLLQMKWIFDLIPVYPTDKLTCICSVHWKVTKECLTHCYPGIRKLWKKALSTFFMSNLSSSPSVCMVFYIHLYKNKLRFYNTFSQYRYENHSKKTISIPLFPYISIQLKHFLITDENIIGFLPSCV